VRNYVVCPTCLYERHHGVANDRTDALELLPKGMVRLTYEAVANEVRWN
jgi:hypothetical protein